jgi:hypothetical protein
LLDPTSPTQAGRLCIYAAYDKPRITEAALAANRRHAAEHPTVSSARVKQLMMRLFLVFPRNLFRRRYF